MLYDICIIGGGAAGLAAAISAATDGGNLKIIILERLDRVGKKLLVTGNGRCNITNRDICEKHYHGTEPGFINGAFSQFGAADTENFFSSLGVPFSFEGNKAFPRSFQAASVVDALRFRCDELGIETRCGQKVSDVQKRNGVFEIKAGETFLSRTVIFATGLLSGGERLGCDGSGLEILKALGHPSAPAAPAIVQLKTETAVTKQLKGIKLDADVSLLREKHAIRREYGEVLFCDYGLSGPPILQLSGSAASGDTISLDMTPEYDFRSMCDNLSVRAKSLGLRKNEEFLSGLLNKRVGQAVMKCAGLAPSDSVSSLKPQDIKRIASLIKSFGFTVTGNTGFVNSQVSHGGILTKNFDASTLMSKKVSGLFAAGEVLDIDGDCGGFNLQWAWSSGIAAAKAAAEYAGEK